MAEAYARKRFREENLDIKVKSAGTLGMPGLMPSKEALKLLLDNNISDEELESKTVTEELLEWADMILVMEPEHKNRILEIIPEVGDKVRFLGEFNKTPGNMIIPDPIGRSMSFYRASFRLIREPVEELILWLKK
jgi:protein-tyrosine phosphatase